MQSHMPSQSIDCLEAEVDHQDPLAVATAQDHILRERHIERPTTGPRHTDPDTTILDTDLQRSWLRTLDFMPIQHPTGPSTATEEDGEQVVSLVHIAEVDAAQVKSWPHTATPILLQVLSV